MSSTTPRRYQPNELQPSRLRCRLSTRADLPLETGRLPAGNNGDERYPGNGCSEGRRGNDPHQQPCHQRLADDDTRFAECAHHGASAG